jgi:flagellar hook-basal body complex protein FliE
MNVHSTALGTGAGSALVSAPAAAPARPANGGSFGQVIQQFVADTNAQQIQADQSVQKLVTGQTDGIHETMLAMAKADLSFRLFVEVQSKVVEAYQDVMRMQM